MVGLIVTYKGMFVVTVGPNHGFCEEIALALFAEEGITLESDPEILTFDPTATGGILIDTEDIDMSGWSLDGWKKT
tara:strand:- start:1774 stop:2001 length:228 start_codon:yes stop_codon:yes gene_type:complete